MAKSNVSPSNAALFCPDCRQPLAHHGCSGSTKGCREPAIMRLENTDENRALQHHDPIYKQERARLTERAPTTARSLAEVKARDECVQTLTRLLETAQTQTQFLEGATAAWHVFLSKDGGVRQGKPSEWKRIGDALGEWFIRNNHDMGVTDASQFAPIPSNGLTQWPTDYRLIKYVLALMPDLSRDTIRKYVKLWRIIYTPVPFRTEAEWRWLAKHDRDEVLAVADLLTKHQHEPQMIHPELDNVHDIAERIARALRHR